MFEVASVLQPSLIFIDEIDSLLSRRRADDADHTRHMKNEFLLRMVLILIYCDQ